MAHPRPATVWHNLHAARAFAPARGVQPCTLQMVNEAHNMKSKTLNRSLHAARATKQDEFYTQLSDIEKELRHYTKYFKNKTVLCNCDDPRVSNF
jgi:hypothetical protein